MSEFRSARVVASLILMLATGCSDPGNKAAQKPAGPRLRPEAITLENFEKLQIGMTRDEVEAIIGIPNNSMYPIPDDKKMLELMTRNGVVANEIANWERGTEPDVVSIGIWYKDDKVLEKGQFHLKK
jgi:hypothetical protein